MRRIHFWQLLYQVNGTKSRALYIKEQLFIRCLALSPRRRHSLNLLPIILIHDMENLSGELVNFKDYNSGSSNGTNLVPIPPAYIRDARYQGDAR